jgi:tripartite-type tricarboxylate transporter receptor subunit TctC
MTIEDGKTMRTFRLSIVAMIAGIAATPMAARAQASYPDCTVKIVVSAPAGGGVDLVARFMADGLGRLLNRTFIVENRPGASGNVGTEGVAVAEPNGCTLLATQPGPLTTNAALYKKVGFDPVAFEPLAIVTKIPNSVAIRASLPVNSVQELIAYAKANPGKLNYSSPGIGSVPHLNRSFVRYPNWHQSGSCAPSGHGACRQRPSGWTCRCAVLPG